MGLTRSGGLAVSITPLLSLLLAGCGQFYWTKPSATYQQFAADHRDCIEKNAVPVNDQPGYGIVPEWNFRACMSRRGWSREQWSVYELPPGRYRGIEDFPTRPISVDSISIPPEQPLSASQREKGSPIQSFDCKNLSGSSSPGQRARCY